MQNYRPGHQVHWIQARKAAEDDGSWREANVDRVDGTVITVRLEGADHPAYFASVGAGHLARSGHDRVVAWRNTAGVMARGVRSTSGTGLVKIISMRPGEGSCGWAGVALQQVTWRMA